MTARPVLSILAEIWDLDAKRARLVAELRNGITREAIEDAIKADPDLRAIFEPAERLRDAVEKLERPGNTTHRG